MTGIVPRISTLIIRNFTNVRAMRTRRHAEACEILASRKDVAEFIKIRGNSDTNSAQTVTILIIIVYEHRAVNARLLDFIY